MPTPENLLAFTLATILLILIPGPSMLFIVGRSISQGRRAGLLSVIGNALGQFPAIIAVSFGVGVIVASSVIAFTIIKIVGAVYLVWLGIQAIRTRKRNHGTPVLKRADALTLLRQGFVVGVTNPKTIAFFVAILPQFVDHKAGPAWSQMLILGLVFFALAVIGDSIWAFAAGAARNWFGKSPKRMEGMSATGGFMMIGLGGVLAFSGSKS